MFSKGKCAVISALFALLFVVMLPLRPQYDVAAGFKITATGERNPAAKGAEVWLSSALLTANESAVQRDGGWERRGESLVSYQGQPATILSNAAITPEDFLVFTKHEYSGIVEISSGDFKRRYDLYSATPGSLRIDFYGTLPLKLNPWRTLGLGLLIYAAAFAAFFAATSLCLRAGAGAGQAAQNRKPGWSLWLMAPSIAVYGLALAAYWPAQMSPDSIDQWRQIVNGYYADAHPVLSTFFYKLAYFVYPAPQAAVIFQILVFSLVTWFFLREMMAWGVPRYVAAIAAIIIPVFPANFMLVTTLWKDVPFTIGIILLSGLAAREVRLGLTLKWGSLIAMGLAGVLIFGVRHNGIVIVGLFFALLLLFAAGRRAKIRAAGALVASIAIFIFAKTLLLSMVAAEPVAPHYRSIFALHVLGAMESAGVEFDPADQALMDKTLPRQEWLNGYNCKSVVPLFWNKHVSYSFLATNAAELNRLMFKEIVRHPGVFLRHQLCVTGLIWRIGGEPGEFTMLSPGEITQMKESKELGLKTRSLLPELKLTLDTWHSQIFAPAEIYTRPALYLLVGLWAALMMVYRSSRAFVLVVAPSLCNCVGLGVLMSAQDYRYLWPSVVLALLTFIMAIGLAMSGRQLDPTLTRAK